MFIKRFLKIAAVMVFIFSASGCGSEGNSNTNGTMILVADATANGAGSVDLVATVTLTTAVAGRALAGAEVSFTVSQYGYNSATGQYDIFVKNASQQIATNSAGVATFSRNFEQISTMATALQVSAVCGGLSQAQTIPIAKLVL